MAVNRRSFMERIVWVATSVAGGALGGVAGGYIFGNVRRDEGAGWIPLTRLHDILPGRPVQIPYRDLVPDAWRTVWLSGSVWLVAGEQHSVTVFDPHCTHMGCPYDWHGDEGVFRCPCHGGVFDIDGQVLEGPPPRPLDRVQGRVVDDQLLIKPGPWDSMADKT